MSTKDFYKNSYSSIAHNTINQKQKKVLIKRRNIGIYLFVWSSNALKINYDYRGLNNDCFLRILWWWHLWGGYKILLIANTVIYKKFTKLCIYNFVFFWATPGGAQGLLMTCSKGTISITNNQTIVLFIVLHIKKFLILLHVNNSNLEN